MRVRVAARLCHKSPCRHWRLPTSITHARHARAAGTRQTEMPPAAAGTPWPAGLSSALEGWAAGCSADTTFGKRAGL